MAEDWPDLAIVVRRAVSDAMNGFFRQVTGVDLPGLSWNWTEGLRTEDSETLGICTEIDVDRMHADLRMWADALSLELLPADRLADHGYIRYGGVLDNGVQATISGRHPDA
jgi:hypothetical protein